MTLRLRLTLVATAVVAVVLGAASLTVYYVMRHELYKQVDSQLLQRTLQLQQRPDAGLRGFDPESSDYFAIVGAAGKVVGGVALPIDAGIKDTAAGQQVGIYYRTTTIQGYHYREVVAPLLPPFTGAVVVARPVDNVTHDLHRLRADPDPRHARGHRCSRDRRRARLADDARAGATAHGRDGTNREDARSE